MYLWLLRPRSGLTPGDDPWHPWYDKSFGFIVRAETCAEARKLADKDAGDENRGEFLEKSIANTKNPWLDSKYSTCEALTESGSSEVIMQDFAAA